MGEGWEEERGTACVKACFNLYLGFLVRYSKTTDTETTVFKEEFITYNSQEEEHTVPPRAIRGSTRVSQEEKEATGKHGPESLL